MVEDVVEVLIECVPAEADRTTSLGRSSRKSVSAEESWEPEPEDNPECCFVVAMVGEVEEFTGEG